MREIARDILINTAAFTAIIPATRISQLGGITSPPDITVGPWAGIRMMPMLKGIGPGEGSLKGSHRQELTLWIYDQPRYYERIDQAHKIARAAFLAAAPRSKVIADGGTVWLTCVEWNGESEDNYDDQWRASTRSASYYFVGSGI
jgi:hypothetical protein